MWRQLAQQQVWHRIGPGMCMLLGIVALCGVVATMWYELRPPTYIPLQPQDLAGFVARLEAEAIPYQRDGTVVLIPVEAYQRLRVGLPNATASSTAASSQPRAPGDNQFAYQREAEQHLASKAQALLDRVFGPNKAVVFISAELRLRTLTEQTEAYVSEGRVLFEEDVTKSRSPGVQRDAAGNAASGARAEDTTRMKWQVPKINRTSEQRFGQIDHLAVALMFVEDKPPESARDRQTVQVNRDEATKLVKQAVGFQEGRDTLQVTVGSTPALNSDPFASETSPPPRSASNVGLGLLATLAAFLPMLAMWLSQRRPVAIQETVAVETVSLGSERVANLKKLADGLRPWVESQ